MPAQTPRSRGRRVAPKKTLSSQWPLIAAGVIVVVVIVAALIYSQSKSSTSGTSGAPIEGLKTFSNLSQDHVVGTVNYSQVPPVGGPHNAVWLNCGIYDQPVPNENAVHSLEHGAVWVTYQPDLPAAEVDQLRNLVRGHSYVVLSPYPGLPTPIVASAWGLQVQIDNTSDPRLSNFIATYEQGPQTPEPGAACTNGKGIPLAK